MRVIELARQPPGASFRIAFGSGRSPAGLGVFAAWMADRHRILPLDRLEDVLHPARISAAPRVRFDTMERLTGVFPASTQITLDGMQFYAGPSAVQKRGVSASPSIKQREGADGRLDLGGNAQAPQDMAVFDVDTDAQGWGIGATVLILEHSRDTDRFRNRIACFEYH